MARGYGSAGATPLVRGASFRSITSLTLPRGRGAAERAAYPAAFASRFAAAVADGVKAWCEAEKRR